MAVKSSKVPISDFQDISPVELMRELGIVEITSPLDEATLDAVDYRFECVQFSAPLTEGDYHILAKFMRKHPHALLRAYDQMAFRILDLEFLRHFPFLKRFQCNLWQMKNFDGLAHLSEHLEELHLGWTKIKSISLKTLNRFPQLRKLSIEGHTKHAEVVGELTELEDLTFRSVKLPGLDILRPLRKLWSLDMKLGGTCDLSVLPEIGVIKYLELWRINGLKDLGVIGEVRTIQYLFLQALKQVKRLPTMKELVRLRRVHIEDLNGLADLSPLQDAPLLEELVVQGRHLQPDHFKCLINHPTLKRLSIGLGSKRRNKEVREFLPLPSVNYGTDFKFR